MKRDGDRGRNMSRARKEDKKKNSRESKREVRKGEEWVKERGLLSETTNVQDGIASHLFPWLLFGLDLDVSWHSQVLLF